MNFTKPYFKEVQTLKLLIHSICLNITKINYTFNEALNIDSYHIKLKKNTLAPIILVTKIFGYIVP